jgi:hypothetical protein
MFPVPSADGMSVELTVATPVIRPVRDLFLILELLVKQQDKMLFLFYGVRFGASSDVVFGCL